jgi:YD repeat-containing protein
MLRYRSLLIFVILALVLTALCPSFAGAANYTYDALNRLIRVDYDNGTYVEYSYDEVGNRLQMGGNQGLTITASAGNNGSISPVGTIPIKGS